MSDDRNRLSELENYECIDPAVGAELWKREVPNTDAETRRRLESHLDFCAACRLRAAVGDELAAGLRTGELRVSGRQHVAWRRARRFSGVGAGALAAGLALMFLIPPVPVGHGHLVRGGERAGIVRPLPDEEIVSARPEIHWHPVDAASSYRVTVRDVAENYDYSEETRANHLQIPADRALPPHSRFRVTVETVPADLSPAGGWRTSFARVSLGEFLMYRVRSSHPLARWTGLAGLLALGTALVLAIRSPRP